MREAGFAAQALLAVEGPADLLKDPEKNWSDPSMRKWIMDTIRRIESERCLLGLSTHIMAAASRP